MPIDKDIDFNLTGTPSLTLSQQSTPTENLLVRAKVIPRSLADIFHVPMVKSGEKKKNHRIVTTARVITSDEYEAQLKEKIETEERKEREKAERKENREEKWKEKDRKNKEKKEKTTNRTKTKQTKKVHKNIDEVNSDDDDGGNEEVDGGNEEVEDENKVDNNLCCTRRQPTRKQGRKFRMVVKQLIMDTDDEETDESDMSSSSSSDDETTDPNNLCAECKSKHPASKRKRKKTVNWIQCDICSKWFHEDCVGSVDNRDEEYFCKMCT